MLDSASRSPGSARTLLISGLVLAVLVTVVPTALWWVGHRSVVRVIAATGVPQCEGTEPTTVRDPITAFERVAIPMTEGFACTLTIRVTNNSDREVTLDQISVPVGGPGGGAGFRVTHLGADAVAADGDLDAVADLGEPLEPGADQLVGMRVVFRKSGCTSAGGHMWVEPTIVVSDLLASHTLIIADLPAFLGTADSSCDT
ncbi:MAG: hypothetical protein WC642_04390 [Nocardioides sp.]